MALSASKGSEYTPELLYVSSSRMFTLFIRLCLAELRIQQNQLPLRSKQLPTAIGMPHRHKPVMLIKLIPLLAVVH